VKSCSPINMAPRPFSRPPVSFSPGDEVPHIFILESHQRPREILISSGKRLFQQHRPISDIEGEAALAAVPLSALPAVAGSPDPIFAAIERMKAAQQNASAVFERQSVLEDGLPQERRQTYLSVTGSKEIVQTDDPRWIAHQEQLIAAMPRM